MIGIKYPMILLTTVAANKKWDYLAVQLLVAVSFADERLQLRG